MKVDTLVSIIIPIYKVENYLEQCLDSCMAQTYKNIEIIAVNDGSPDSCGDIIDRYAATDNRIKHLRQENQGVSAARYNGIIMSKGDYIMHVDGDDFIPENAVLCMLEEALEHDCDMIFSDYYHVKGNELHVETLALTNGLMMSGKEFFDETIRFEIWGRLTKRDLFLQYEIPKFNMGEGIFTMVQILNNCKCIRYIKCPLYYYRTHEDSTLYSPLTVKNEIENNSAFIHFIIENNYPKALINSVILKTLTVLSNYCNDYDNPITAATKQDIDKLIRVALKNYPRLLRDNLLNIDSIKLIMVTYLLRYFPKSITILHKYTKL